VSLLGLLASAAAIGWALNARFAEAGICLMLAFLADVYDGPIAKRLTGRTDADRAFGANLDSLIDIIGAGIVPGIILLSYGDFAGWYVPGAFLLVASAALRLSYFNVYGLGPSATHYTGVPTDLVILTFGALLLLEVVVPAGVFPVVLYACSISLAFLMVSSIQMRKLDGGWYYILPVVACLIGLAHAARLIA
jgi:CDP-diacylglycerol--serine O-phosphatidyltransferase